MEGFSRTVESLVGQELSTVSFVRNYVEFHFDGPVLRALSNPHLEQRTGTTSFPDSGSRDALCTLIGRTVREVDRRDGVHIRLTFDDGAILTVPSDQTGEKGGEGATFQSEETGLLQVWN